MQTSAQTSAERTMTAGEEQGTGKEGEIYRQRFTPAQTRTRNITWEILCRNFFQRYIRPEDTVLDLAAGEGQFITQIKAKRRIAVDLNPTVRALSAQGVEVHELAANQLATKLRGEVDLIFTSNFFEHLPTKRALLDVLDSCRDTLKPGGRLLVLQPNIRYTGVAYWDYIDHHIALTEHSLAEALEISGFKVEELIPRFLPYTARSKVGAVASGSTRFFVTAYLKLPFLWRIFGAQTFVVARKAG